MDDVFAKWEQKFIDKGYKQGQNSSVVRTCQDFGKTKDETIAYLIQKYGMTKDDAHATTQQYWMQ